MNKNYQNHSNELRRAIDSLEPWYDQVEKAVDLLKAGFKAGKTVYVAGNGGSATLAQHLSDEMVGRYESDRPAYPVVALTTDGAVLTVIGNDYGYEHTFSRQIEALGREGDIFMGFSTSGTSKNILMAAEMARKKGMKIISFTGNTGTFKDLADVAVVSPAKATSRIQELDLHAIHLMCEAFEPEQKQRRMGMDRIEELLGHFVGKRIMVVGDVMLDKYLAGIVERVNPEAPVPVLRAQQEREVTGGAGNAAKNAATLGAKVILVSVVGQDDMAARIDKAAQSEGYESRFIQDPSRPTISKTRFLAKIRESNILSADPIEGSQQLLRVDWENRDKISGVVEEKVIQTIKQIAGNGIDGILVSDYDKGVITKNVAAAIMEVARKHNIVVAADLKPSNGPLFKGANIISPNRKEAHEYLGLDPIAQPTGPAEIAKRLRERMDTGVFVTLGPDGMYVNAGGVNQHVPQDHVVKVYDVSGAGDTAVVTLLLSRLAGANPLEAAKLANAAGAVVVGKVGTVAITPDELRSMLLHRHK
ncbi:MAG: SIS domain-containing protein [Candidatus Andersenbacteria bacterium]|nr:SIS domain-containing protein [Candidatus Andersenbacteria bacterium]MBI3251091.1 SIS domain-containing protein [Candidatus Andersenbacteria bacterium]